MGKKSIFFFAKIVSKNFYKVDNFCIYFLTMYEQLFFFSSLLASVNLNHWLNYQIMYWRCVQKTYLWTWGFFFYFH